MNARVGYAVALLFVASLSAGCASTRSEISISSPTAAPTRQAAAGRAVYIRSVTDERVFEQTPREPGSPSLGFEGAEQASSDVKARAVGRKRSAYGKAMGDVLLQNRQTVVGIVRENLTAAFRNAGYRVVTDPTGTPIVVDVRIKQFWAWFTPGFASIKLSANIETDLGGSGGGAPTSIRVHVDESRQAATNGAWVQILEKALGDYRVQVESTLSKRPF